MKVSIASLLFIGALCCLVEARTDSYYDTVNDVLNGLDYYKTLGLSEEANEQQIKKVYRELAKQYHPDKTSNPEDKEFYILLVRIVGVLLDDEKRNEYLLIQRHGVNLNDRYYGRHAHKYGAPEDARVAAVVFLAILTFLKYIIQRYRYHMYQRLAKNTKQYQKAVAENGGEEVPVNIIGAQPPTWTDLLPIAVWLWLWGVFDYLSHVVRGKSAEYNFKKSKAFYEATHGPLSDDEFKKLLAKDIEQYQARFEQARNSNRAKRYYRFMKKHVQ